MSVLTGVPAKRPGPLLTRILPPCSPAKADPSPSGPDGQEVRRREFIATRDSSPPSGVTFQPATIVTFSAGVDRVPVSDRSPTPRDATRPRAIVGSLVRRHEVGL
jgi:hypothetical protein